MSPHLKENQVLLKIKLHFEIVVYKHARTQQGRMFVKLRHFAFCYRARVFFILDYVFRKYLILLYITCYFVTFLFFLLNFYNVGLDLLIILGCFPITMLKCSLYEVTCVHIQEKCALNMFITLTRTFFLTLLHEGTYRTTKKTA